ncbi:cell wall biosynthesis protein [Methanobrevibacter sp. 87.7]|uniref:cell wall biosynthesis protein n=1 Tax=Methanobrevibacter sp. 87.7 TaxID=387957 RepID=UPI001E45775C|nr:cell wall biosynthesis protein [Methanobrevibacter sp. 87.7]
MYMGIINALITVFILTFIGTGVIDIVFRRLGEKGYIKNLYPNVRGGTPRAVGIILFLVLIFYLPSGYNDLVLIMGLFALVDDLLGRKTIGMSSMEWGQLSRGIGMICVMIAGFYLGLGISSIFIALLIQPVNISDMQPGSTCIVTIILSALVAILMVLLNRPMVEEIPAFYTPLLILVATIAYSPLDFSGKIMLGEVGNHSLAIALGLSFYMLGGLPAVIIFFIITTFLIAFVRRNTLKTFFVRKMELYNPVFMDYVMDVLTGGGLGDYIRKLIWKDKQPETNNSLAISLGAKRLLFNPEAHRMERLDY